MCVSKQTCDTKQKRFSRVTRGMPDQPVFRIAGRPWSRNYRVIQYENNGQTMFVAMTSLSGLDVYCRMLQYVCCWALPLRRKSPRNNNKSCWPFSKARHRELKVVGVTCPCGVTQEIAHLWHGTYAHSTCARETQRLRARQRQGN